MCLPFLRVAALLRHHLYKQPIPLIQSPQEEFVTLVYYLELVTEGMDRDIFNSLVALNWKDSETAIEVPRLWCEQYKAFVYRSEIAAKNLIVDQHISWHMPKLFSLPREYEKIFTVCYLLYSLNAFKYIFLNVLINIWIKLNNFFSKNTYRFSLTLWSANSKFNYSYNSLLNFQINILNLFFSYINFSCYFFSYNQFFLFFVCLVLSWTPMSSMSFSTSRN